MNKENTEIIKKLFVYIKHLDELTTFREQPGTHFVLKRGDYNHIVIDPEDIEVLLPILEKRYQDKIEKLNNELTFISSKLA